ncbi:hypothetical protein DFG55_10495 [Xanthomonas campestris pv. campestris]|nr:hypothetical protein DFG55_10495 [Xanthomonas campestris pv. campestris]QCX72712.1 hypothetical protein DFG54_19920 [Xanthomonas campestris pv. campestris]
MLSLLGKAWVIFRVNAFVVPVNSSVRRSESENYSPNLHSKVTAGDQHGTMQFKERGRLSGRLTYSNFT